MSPLYELPELTEGSRPGSAVRSSAAPESFRGVQSRELGAALQGKSLSRLRNSIATRSVPDLKALSLGLSPGMDWEGRKGKPRGKSAAPARA